MGKVKILTSTLYKSRSETRFRLACKLVANAIKSRYSVTIMDNSSDSSIGRELSMAGVRVFKQKTADGIGNQRRELFKIASKYSEPSDIFLWTEPEKVNLIRLIPKIVAPIQTGKADIVIPSRTRTSFSSYPGFQVKSERKANSIFETVTGRRLDVMFGPVAFSGKVLSYLVKCNPLKSYGVADAYIQNVAAMEAMADGFKAVSVPIDFIYPPDQKLEEETKFLDMMLKKRRRQFNELTKIFRVVAKKLKLLK